MKAKCSKHAFFIRQLQYLGHLISGEGIYPLEENLETIFDLELPTRDVTKTRHIIGLALYYRKFIANFSNIVKPLPKLTKKHTNFNWNPHCQ